MLTSITLENFKGIGALATIPLRPLTIMFGKNSAGKSTVVQALHYAREIFERGNLNADRTLLGGASVDLGGFHNLVNNHDETKAITMRFEMDLRDAAFPEYDFAEHLEYKSSVIYQGHIDEENPDQYSNDLSKFIKNAAVELKIEWSKVLERPLITSYKTWINDVEAVQISGSIDGKNMDVRCNHVHPVLFSNSNNVDNAEPDEEIDLIPIEIYSYKEVLPKKANPLVMSPGQADEVGYIDDLSLTQMLVAPTDLLREWLASLRYIGPLRETPPRNFQPALTENESDWANGLAAWRELYNKNDFFLDLELMHWLEEKLKTGYQVELKQFREIPLDSPLMIALTNNTVFDDIADTANEVAQFPIKKRLVLIEEKSKIEVMPHDIGVGISQVIPVIVAAIFSNHRMVAIEQPELHLHPAMQSELGDLFIESALGDHKNFFLIETHSEHLILRVLRRIREYAEGEQETSSAPAVTPNDVQLIYVEPAKGGTVFYNLPVTKEGDFAENVPGGFFAERAKELF